MLMSQDPVMSVEAILASLLTTNLSYPRLVKCHNNLTWSFLIGGGFKIKIASKPKKIFFFFSTFHPYVSNINSKRFFLHILSYRITTSVFKLVRVWPWVFKNKKAGFKNFSVIIAHKYFKYLAYAKSFVSGCNTRLGCSVCAHSNIYIYIYFFFNSCALLLIAPILQTVLVTFLIFKKSWLQVYVRLWKSKTWDFFFFYFFSLKNETSTRCRSWIAHHYHCQASKK
jgi:hypothetical protein